MPISYCPSHDWDRYINSFDDSTNCPACGEDDWDDCDAEYLEPDPVGGTGTYTEYCCGSKCKNCGYCHDCHEAGRLELTILPENYYIRKCGWCGEEVHPMHQDHVRHWESGEPIICHPICKNALRNQQNRLVYSDWEAQRLEITHNDL
jgi:hypothetical protein